MVLLVLELVQALIVLLALTVALLQALMVLLPLLALVLLLMVLLAPAATGSAPAHTSLYMSVRSAAKVSTAAFSWALRTASSREGSAGRPISHTRAGW